MARVDYGGAVNQKTGLLRGTRIGGLGCPDINTEPSNTIWRGNLEKKIDQDFCPIYKSEQDKRMLNLFVVPPKWADRPERWGTHVPDGYKDTVGALERYKSDVVSGRHVVNGAVVYLPLPPSTALELPRLSDAGSGRGSKGSSCSGRIRTRQGGCEHCDNCGLSVADSQQLDPSATQRNPQVRLTGLERAKSAPLITRQRGKARSDYGRPPLGHGYNFASIHKKSVTKIGTSQWF